jgi:hypothetical protein
LLLDGGIAGALVFLVKRCRLGVASGLVSYPRVSRLLRIGAEVGRVEVGWVVSAMASSLVGTINDSAADWRQVVSADAVAGRHLGRTL